MNHITKTKMQKNKFYCCFYERNKTWKRRQNSWYIYYTFFWFFMQTKFSIII